MSVILCICFLLMLTGAIPVETISNDYLIIWALFAIADALWFRNRK